VLRAVQALCCLWHVGPCAHTGSASAAACGLDRPLTTSVTNAKQRAGSVAVDRRSQQSRNHFPVLLLRCLKATVQQVETQARLLGVLPPTSKWHSSAAHLLLLLWLRLLNSLGSLATALPAGLRHGMQVIRRRASWHWCCRL
jgi:hypothetical protein